MVSVYFYKGKQNFTPEAWAVQSDFHFKSTVFEGERGVALQCRTWQTLNHLSQVIKVNINSDKSNWWYVPMICNENGILPLWSSLPKSIIPEKSWEKLLTYPSSGRVYKTPNQYSPKLSRSSKTRKIWNTVTAKRSLRRHDNNVVWYTGWNPGT